MIVSCPLYVDLPRKTKKDRRIRLNLNVYRNLNYHINNDAKELFNKVIKKQIIALPQMEMIAIRFVLYPGTKTLCDTANICCIVEKFFCDALTHFNIIPDDNYNHIVGTSAIFGGIDRDNPRVDAHIIERTKPFYTGE